MEISSTDISTETCRYLVHRYLQRMWGFNSHSHLQQLSAFTDQNKHIYRLPLILMKTKVVKRCGIKILELSVGSWYGFIVISFRNLIYLK